MVMTLPCRCIRPLLAFLAALLLAPPALAQRPFLVQTDASEALVSEARGDMMAFRMEDSERALRRLQHRPDGAIAAMHNLAAAALLKAVMSDREADYAAFHERSDSVLTLLKGAPEGRWRLYLEAENHLQRMVVFAKEERYTRAALAARAAYGRSEEAIRRYPDFYEPYKGMGLLHVSIGSLPRSYRTLLRLLGYGGEVNEGMKELQIAAEESRFSREEAVLGRALVQGLLFGDTEDAEAMLSRVYQSNPSSPLFAFFYGFALVKNRKAAEAEKVFARASRTMRSDGYFPVDYVDHFLGEALFQQGRYAEAERAYRRYLAAHRGPALRAPTNLNLALSIEMQDRREEAVAFYRSVESHRKYDTDEAALRLARKRLAAPMTSDERLLLEASGALNARRFSKAEALLARAAASPAATADDLAQAAYLVGRTKQAQEQWDEALRAFGAAAAYPRDPKARWAPWSRYYSGQIYSLKGNPDKAREAFNAALDYDGQYDYYQTLEQSAKAALKRLGS